MILVFILLTIIILTILIMHITILSTLRISIKNLEISNMKKTENIKNINNNYQVIFSLWVFNKIKWFQFKLNDKRMKKMYTKMQLEKYDFKKLQQEFKLEDLKQIPKLKPNISLLDLEIKLGTEDAILTSFIIFFISTAISVALPHLIKKYEKDKYEYQITPIYINQNVYEIKFNCIIELKMVHIINIIYVLVKKRREEKDERSSNRRSYGYSYE